MPTTAETIFNEVQTERHLEEFCDAKTREDLYLEFKQRSRASDEEGRKKGDREAFSKAVAGFANADGGVLIFGVATDKGPDGIDCAHALMPFEDRQRFSGLLEGWANHAAQFPVDGIRVGAIDAVGGGRGYVKCLIPKSDKVPHRSSWGAKAYWRRTVGHREMEHYEVAEAFGARTGPALELEIAYWPARSHTVEFQFHNQGRGIALHAGLLCRFLNAAIEGTSHNVMNISDRLRDHGGHAVEVYLEQHAVHCGKIHRYLGTAGLANRSKDEPLQIDVHWYAERMEMRSSGVIEVPPDRWLAVPWRP